MPDLYQPESVISVKKISPPTFLQPVGDFSLCLKKECYCFVCALSGHISIESDSFSLTLKAGEIIFFNCGRAFLKGGHSTAVFMSFECGDEILILKNKALQLQSMHKTLLSLMLKEGRTAFYPPEKRYIGGAQLVKTYLEQLLISLMRTRARHFGERDFTLKDDSEEIIIETIVHYLKSNIGKQLYLDDICRDICFSKSYIKQLFSKKMGVGIMRYFSGLKIDEAKRLIANGGLSFTEISEKLGFSSVHYFSRFFKSKTGMAPRLYAKKFSYVQA